MKQWCCCTWEDLSPELAGMKVTQLEKLLKRGIPKSTFSPVFRIIEGMGNFCPLCGTRIGNTMPMMETPVEVKKETPPPFVSKTPAEIKCPVCCGTSKVGSGLNCMICLGTGKLDKSNPHRKQFDGAYAQEIADKMEANEKAKEELRKKIESSPKPLREDARPENWAKL